MTIQKRGYSLSKGLITGITLVVIDWIYTVWSNLDAYSALDDAGQSGFVMGLLLKGCLIFFIGVLCGFIGAGKLEAICLDCGHKSGLSDSRKGR